MNYVDGTLCGQYLEFFPSGQKRVVADFGSSGVRKHWKEFDEEGKCIIDEYIIAWNVKSKAGGSSDIEGKTVSFSDLYQDTENRLFFHKANNLLYSGWAVSEKSETGDIIKSYNFLGGQMWGSFQATKR